MKLLVYLFVFVGFTNVFSQGLSHKEKFSRLRAIYNQAGSIQKSEIPFYLEDFKCIGYEYKKSLTGKGGNYLRDKTESLVDIVDDFEDLDNRWTTKYKLLSNQEFLFIGTKIKYPFTSAWRSKATRYKVYLCSCSLSEGELYKSIETL